MAKNRKNPGLFPDYNDQSWEEWQGMPEYKHEDKTPYHSLTVYFETKEDFDAFQKLIEERISKKSRFCYFPKPRLDKGNKYFYGDE
jgi:hypothetical protein